MLLIVPPRRKCFICIFFAIINGFAVLSDSVARRVSNRLKIHASEKNAEDGNKHQINSILHTAVRKHLQFVCRENKQLFGNNYYLRL